MTITIPPLKNVSSYRLPVQEGQRVEFKVSAFRAPKDSKHRQVETIAREIAAFMNADGGDLYLGVKDNGVVVGIQKDLNALSSGLDETIVRGPGLDDSAWCAENKTANEDAYARKINQIVQGYLGQSACQWLGDVEFQRTDDDFVYARVPVMRASKGEVVLFQVDRWSDLMVRTQGRMQCFKDRERDRFVMLRTREVALEENESYRKKNEEVLSSLLERVSQIQVHSDIEEPTVAVCRDDSSDNVNQNGPVRNDQKGAAVENSRGNSNEKQPDDAARRLREISVAAEHARENARLIIERMNQKMKNEIQYSVLRRGYDLRCSSTWIMDEFEKKENDKFIYDRLELFHMGNGLTFLPYDYDCERDENFRIVNSRDGYKRISGCNFRISKVELLVERVGLTDVHLCGCGLSFSDLKKGIPGDLPVAIWASIDQNVLSAPFAMAKDEQKLALMFKRPIGFRAHTSESFDMRSLNDPNRYQVVGVRFLKEKLYYSPDHLSDADYYQFEKNNERAFYSKVKQMLESVVSSVRR